MSTAIDSNVLFDILLPDHAHRADSASALSAAALSGELLISEPVYAELSARFSDHSRVDAFIDRLEVSVQPSTKPILHLAGQAWDRYLAARQPAFGCPVCGASVQVHCEKCGSQVTRRQHVLADFMIGAHALVHAGRLLTRDRGHYGTYFPDLVLI